MDTIALAERLRPEIEAEGYFLVELSVASDCLRVIIHKKGGVGHSDCIAIFKFIRAFFEDEDETVLEEYRLEISSPGLSRKLKSSQELQYFIDDHISVTHRAEDGSSITVAGVNKGISDGKLMLLSENDLMLEIAEKSIKKIKLQG